MLLTGENGVGKTLLARVIHFTSRRQNMPLLSINCATLTEDLLARELFGSEEEAVAGPHRTSKGLIEIADNGTLFLDGVTGMSPALQVKLLKIIEDAAVLQGRRNEAGKGECQVHRLNPSEYTGTYPRTAVLMKTYTTA